MAYQSYWNKRIKLKTQNSWEEGNSVRKVKEDNFVKKIQCLHKYCGLSQANTLTSVIDCSVTQQSTYPTRLCQGNRRMTILQIYKFISCSNFVMVCADTLWWLAQPSQLHLLCRRVFEINNLVKTTMNISRILKSHKQHMSHIHYSNSAHICTIKNEQV